MKYIKQAAAFRLPVNVALIAFNMLQPRQPVGLTTTVKNRRLREARHEVWRKADATTRYWRALLEFTDAVLCAQRHGVKEAGTHAETSQEERLTILNSYREALGEQLLTPAPDVGAVNWKRHQLNKAYGLRKELVEKAMADDLAFLHAHPTRHSRHNKAVSDAHGLAQIIADRHSPQPQGRPK